ncbi:uncharacterized protein LOC143878757 [Tasmannia lanceolata]|uniref:uncharacterized protein LOC143878757 n=1 Tax=Tasmannia lanceolata TaxID=3420 RepID=UPI004063E04D
MKTLNSRTLLLHFSSSRSPTPRFFPILLFHSNTTDEIQKKRAGFSSSPHSPSSPSWRHHDEDSRNVKVSVWWDIENCSVPIGVNVYRVAHHITSALRANGIKGPVTITAFGDVSQISRSNQEALSSTGICLTHVPHGGKNCADRSLLVDLVYWVSQNPPPAHLFLISGDRDFANILHRLRMNNYNILLASSECAPGVLCSAASIMWPWNGMVRGDSLIGKHFNHPPDGVYGSWYGHYKGPLDDPFLDMERSTCSQPEDSSELGTDLKTRPIPKAIVNRIQQILKSYPEGVSLSDLRAELVKNNVHMDKDFFGYRKFSRFLLSMPTILRLQRRPLGEGQHLVHGIHPKSTELVDSSQQLSPEVETTDDHHQSGEHQPLACDIHLQSVLPVESNLKSSDRLEVPDGHKDHRITVDVNEKSSISPSQLKGEEPSIGREEIDISSGIVDSTPKLEHNLKSEEGFLQRIRRTWFGHRSGYSNENSNAIPAIFSASIDSSSSSKDANANVKSHSGSEKIECNNKTSKPRLEEKDDNHSVNNDVKSPPKSGTINQIVLRCQFWKTREESPDRESEFSNQAKESRHIDECEVGREYVNSIAPQLENHDLFSKAYFWDDLESFLNTPKGLALISRAWTREQLVQELQKEGPLILNSLPAIHFPRLTDMLISERKWVEECSSQTFPFKVTLPAKRCFSPSNVRGSNGLSSIFLGTSSQPHLWRRPENGLEKRDHNLGPLGNVNVNTKRPENGLEKRDHNLGPVGNGNFNTKQPENGLEKRDHNLGPVGNGNVHTKQPENGLEKRDHNLRSVGNGNVNTKQPQSLADLKVWLRKFRNGTGKIEVEDFRRHFEREFNTNIDCGFYGSSSMENLLALCLSNDDNSGKRRKKSSNMSRVEIIADCQKLLSEMLEKNPEGFNMGPFKPMFLQRYGYSLDHEMLGYPKLASLLQTMPGVKLESSFILPAEKVPIEDGPEKSVMREMLAFVTENRMGKVSNSDLAESAKRNIGSDPPADQDSVWEELGPVSKGVVPRNSTELGLDGTGLVSEMGIPGDGIESEILGKSNGELDEQIDFNELPLSDEEFSDSEGENRDVDGSKGQEKQKKSNEDSTLLQILDSWYDSKDKSKDQFEIVDGLVDCSRSIGSKLSGSSGISGENSLGTENHGLKLKPRKIHSFVLDPVNDDKNKLIDSMLVSLKKSSDSRMQS